MASSNNEHDHKQKSKQKKEKNKTIHEVETIQDLNTAQSPFFILDELANDYKAVIQRYNRQRAELAFSTDRKTKRIVAKLRLRSDAADYLSRFARQQRDREAFLFARAVEMWNEMWKLEEERHKEEEENTGSKEGDMGDRRECIAEAGKDEDGEIEQGGENDTDEEEMWENDEDPPSLQIERESRQRVLWKVERALTQELAAWDRKMAPQFRNYFQCFKRLIYVLLWLTLAAVLLAALLHLLGDVVENGLAHSLHVAQSRVAQLWTWLGLEEASRGSVTQLGHTLKAICALPLLLMEWFSTLVPASEHRQEQFEPPQRNLVEPILSPDPTVDSLSMLKELVIYISPLCTYLHIAALAISHNGRVARESKLHNAEELARGYDEIYAGMKNGVDAVNEIGEGVWFLVTKTLRDLNSLAYRINAFKAEQLPGQAVPNSLQGQRLDRQQPESGTAIRTQDIALANLLIEGLTNFAEGLTAQIATLIHKIVQANKTYTALDLAFAETERLRLQIENRVEADRLAVQEREQEQERWQREKNEKKHVSSWGGFSSLLPWNWGQLFIRRGPGGDGADVAERERDREQERRERVVQRMRERSLQKLEADSRHSRLWLERAKIELDGLQAALTVTLQDVAYLERMAGVESWNESGTKGNGKMPNDGSDVWRMRAAVRESFDHIQSMIVTVHKLFNEGQAMRAEKSKASASALDACLGPGKRERKGELLANSLECLVQELGLDLENGAWGFVGAVSESEIERNGNAEDGDEGKEEDMSIK